MFSSNSIQNVDFLCEMHNKKKIFIKVFTMGKIQYTEIIFRSINYLLRINK